MLLTHKGQDAGLWNAPRFPPKQKDKVRLGWKASELRESGWKGLIFDVDLAIKEGAPGSQKAKLSGAWRTIPLTTTKGDNKQRLAERSPLISYSVRS